MSQVLFYFSLGFAVIIVAAFLEWRNGWKKRRSNKAYREYKEGKG